MSLAPDRCLVIEDAAAGIAAAKRAEMKAIGITNILPRGKLTSADRVVKALRSWIRRQSPNFLSSHEELDIMEDLIQTSECTLFDPRGANVMNPCFTSSPSEPLRPNHLPT